MPKLIKTLQERVNFAVKKGLSGFISPETLVREAYPEILNVWRKHIKTYEDTREIGMYLAPFEARESVSSLSGTSTEGFKAVTSCHQYPILVTTTAGIRVEILTIGEYANRFTHPIKGPEAAFPICKFESNTIYVAPRTDVIVHHLKKPIQPVFSYTVSGDDYLYNDGASTDLEFDEMILDDIVNRVLANMGINMRDGELVNYSNQNKATEGV